MTKESDIDVLSIFNSLNEIHEHHWCKNKDKMAILIDLASKKLLTVYKVIICI